MVVRPRARGAGERSADVSPAEDECRDPDQHEGHGAQPGLGAEAGRPVSAPPTMFGFTEAQISQFGLTFGIAAFMLYMLFIIGHLAWESKAGKFGTFVLFLGLAVGFIGFIAKAILQWYLEK